MGFLLIAGTVRRRCAIVICQDRSVVAMNLSDPRWAKLTPLLGAVICGLFLGYIVTQGQPYSLLSLVVTVILVACVLWLVLRSRI